MKKEPQKTKKTTTATTKITKTKCIKYVSVDTGYVLCYSKRG